MAKSLGLDKTKYGLIEFQVAEGMDSTLYVLMKKHRALTSGWEIFQNFMLH